MRRLQALLVVLVLSAPGISCVAEQGSADRNSQSQRPPSGHSPSPYEELLGQRLCSVLPKLRAEGLFVFKLRDFGKSSAHAGRIVEQGTEAPPSSIIPPGREVVLTSMHPSTIVIPLARVSMERNGYNGYLLDVQGRRDLIKALGEMGFSEVIIFPLGKIVRAEVDDQADGDLVARLLYRLPDGSEVGTFQVDRIVLPSAGKPMSVRKTDGLRVRSTVHWAERGYSLAMFPANRMYARTLGWRQSCGPH